MALRARALSRTVLRVDTRPDAADRWVPVLVVAVALGVAATLSHSVGQLPTPLGVAIPLDYAWLVLVGGTLVFRLQLHQRRVSRRLGQLEQEYAAIRRHTAGSAHDMRAPMVTVSSYLELLAGGGFGPLPAAAQRAAAQALRACSRARLLVEGTLAASMSDATHGPDAAAMVDLNAVVGDVVASLGAEIARTHAELAVAPLPVVRGSEPAYYRIFENLVQNALRYTKADTAPHIAIAASDCAHGVEISVRDEGCGIRPEDRERVFLERVRGAHSGSDGLGLGLATVRELVTHVGGSIWIDPAVSDGTCVRVRLPVIAASHGTS